MAYEKRIETFSHQAASVLGIQKPEKFFFLAATIAQIVLTDKRTIANIY